LFYKQNSQEVQLQIAYCQTAATEEAKTLSTSIAYSRLPGSGCTRNPGEPRSSAASHRSASRVAEQTSKGEIPKSAPVHIIGFGQHWPSPPRPRRGEARAADVAQQLPYGIRECAFIRHSTWPECTASRSLGHQGVPDLATGDVCPAGGTRSRILASSAPVLSVIG
jgi:hypothetical protein